MADAPDLVELLESKANRKTSRRRRRRPLWKRLHPVLLLYAIAPIFAVVIVFGVLIVDAGSNITKARDDFDLVLNSLSEKSATELTLADYDQIDASLAALEDALQGANTRIMPLRFAGAANRDIDARLTLLESASHSVIGTRNFLAGMKPVIALLERGQASDTDSGIAIAAIGERSVELLRAGQPRFIEAQVEFNNAKVSLGELTLEGISADTLLDIETLQEFIDLAETYNLIAINAPELLSLALGLDETQTYLVLSQNNDEIRPSGGYISTWGWLQIRDAQIEGFDYFPTTPTSPQPPSIDAFAATYQIPEWWLQFDAPQYAAWDGSWHADFPATAEMNLWFYNNGDNPHTPVDGIIAIDIDTLELFVGALGSIAVPAYDVEVNAGNFREITYTIRATDRAHKQFLADMFNEVIAVWQTADTDTRIRVNRVFLQALREKHLILYFTNSELQAANEAIGWGGAQNFTAAHDYLMAADANLGSKSSSSVPRQITYDAVINDDQTINSRLSLFYEFPAELAEDDPAVSPEHYIQLDYLSLLQVFTPANVVLIPNDADGATFSINETTFTRFTHLVEVEYDTSTRVQFEYNIPDVIEQLGDYSRYRLHLEKPPGTVGDDMSITVFLPAGSSIIDISPKPSVTYELGQPVLEFNLTLERDMWIEITYSE